MNGLITLIYVLKGGPGSGPQPKLFAGPRPIPRDGQDPKLIPQEVVEPLDAEGVQQQDETLLPLLTDEQRDIYGNERPSKADMDADIAEIEAEIEADEQKHRERAQKKRSRRAKLRAMQRKRREALQKIQQERRRDVRSTSDFLSS